MCGGAPRAVIPGGILKCRDPACTHPKTYLRFKTSILFEGRVGLDKIYYTFKKVLSIVGSIIVY